MKKSRKTFSIKDRKQEQRKTRESEILFSFEYLRSALAIKKGVRFYYLLW